MCLREQLFYTQALICHQSSKGWALPDKEQAALPSQLRAEPRPFKLLYCLLYAGKLGEHVAGGSVWIRHSEGCD